MDFAICLDQFSTNFNVSSLSPNGFSVYTDLDYNNPIASGIPYQDLFAPPIGNCPLIVNVPQGATQLLVIDACTTLPTNVAPIFNAGNSANSLITQCCYAILPVPVEPISWCDTSDLEFDVFSSSFVGQIIAGNLTSTLGTVTDYTIGWYKDGDYSAPEFVSGYGNSFIPYQLTHPLAGNTAPYVTAGDWEGIIHDIAINGVTYSSVSGSANGTPIPFESCFGTIVVAPLQCDNGTFPLPYTHQKIFTAVGNGAPPPTIATTYELDSSTNYFAYKFAGFSIWDELEIKFISGDPNNTGNPSLYSQPIYLEKAQIGTNTTSNIGTLAAITNNTYPKKIKYDFFKRILTLTNISRSANPSLPDRLDIKITPNPTNTQTNWTLDMQCLDTFDCEDCLNPFPPVKISELFLDRSCCGLQFPQTTLSGSCDCGNDIWTQRALTTPPPSTNWSYSEGYTLGYSGLANHFISGGNSVTTVTQQIAANSVSSCVTYGGQQSISSCAPVTANSIISYHKSTTTVNGQLQGIISMSFNNSTDYLHYKNKLIAEENLLQQNVGSITYNATLPQYYTYFNLVIPTTNIPCGDGIPVIVYYIHRTAYPNIIYVEDPINNYWSITIPMPTITNGIVQSSCSPCYNNMEGIVSQVNYSALNTSDVNVSNIYGSKFLNPWWGNYSVPTTPGTLNSIDFAITSYTRNMPYYSWHTLPFVSSSTGWVNLSSLGGVPCPSLISSSMPYGTSISPTATFLNVGYTLSGFESGFFISFPNLTGSSDWFQLYTFVSSSNGQTPNQFSPTPGQMIYEYTASIGTVYSSSYFVNGAPIVTIDPWPNC
jgi:hypothetical protein